MRKIILSQDEEIKIIQLYTEGYSMNRVCKTLNYSIHVVTNVLIKNNVSRRKDPNRKYTFNESYFKKIDCPNKAYWLGWLISDGNIIKNYIRIRIQEDDLKILQQFKKDISFTGNISIIPKRKQHHKNLVSLTLTSNNTVIDLSQWGCVPNKTHKTYFPNIPEIFWNHFIRGYFDGDGCIHVNKNGFLHFHVTGNLLLISKINEILSEKSGVSLTKLHIRSNNTTATLNYSGNNVVKNIGNWLYQNCGDLYLQRKYDKFFNSENKLTKPGRLEQHGCTKLSNLDVINIYNSQTLHKELAKEYGVAKSTISAIKNGQNWNELTNHKPTLLTELK